MGLTVAKVDKGVTYVRVVKSKCSQLMFCTLALAVRASKCSKCHLYNLLLPQCYVHSYMYQLWLIIIEFAS